MKSLADRYLSRWYAPHKLNGGRGRKIDSDRRISTNNNGNYPSRFVLPLRSA